MENKNNKQLASVFEQIKHTDENGNEFWSTRELSKVLEYSEYRHFLPVLATCKRGMFQEQAENNRSFRGYPRNDNDRKNSET